MAAQRLSFIFGWNSKWPLVLPAVLRHRGNIFITAYIIPKHSFLHGNESPPVLTSPASLIDYIASYKLSMVHKLCSAEHNTAQCWPAGTRTFRAPASSLSPGWDLLSKLCDEIPGFRAKTGKDRRSLEVLKRAISVWVCFTYKSADQTHSQCLYAKHTLWLYCGWTVHALPIVCITFCALFIWCFNSII